MNFKLCEDNNRPLKNKVFYLDIKISKKLAVASLIKDLKSFGGLIEEFFCKDISFVITDRPDWKPSGKNVDHWAPDTPNSTPSPYSLTKCEFGDFDSSVNEVEVKKSQHQTSRGQRLLEQATKHRRSGSTDVLELCQQWGIRILRISDVLNWLEKRKKKLTRSVDKMNFSKSLSLTVPVVGVKQLVPPFIKVEDKRRIYKTFYKEFTKWPDVVFKSGAAISNPSNRENFNGKDSNLKKQDTNVEGFAAQTRDICKNKSVKENEAPKRKAFCEICSTSFTNLQQHMNTKYHRSFLSDRTNFSELRRVVSTLPSVSEFCFVNGDRRSQNLNLSKVEKTETPQNEQKNRRSVATNLAQKFDLCWNENAQKNTIKAQYNEMQEESEDEQIEASCASPPYYGFPFLEGNVQLSEHSVLLDSHANQVHYPPQMSSHASFYEPSPFVKDLNICVTSGFHREMTSNNIIESALETPTVLSPPDSQLCYFDDIPQTSIAENVFSITNCPAMHVDAVPLKTEQNVNCSKDSSFVIDLVPLHPCNLPEVLTSNGVTTVGLGSVATKCDLPELKPADFNAQLLNQTNSVKTDPHIQGNTRCTGDKISQSSYNHGHHEEMKHENQNKLILADVDTVDTNLDYAHKDNLEATKEKFCTDIEANAFSINEEWCPNCCPECNDICISEDNEEFEPLNLCTTGKMIHCNPEHSETAVVKKRLIECSTPIKKIRVLSDRSMKTLFNSDNDEQEFSGFKPGEKNDTSDLSYVEVSHSSEIVAGDHVVNNFNQVGTEHEDKWDGSRVEFINGEVNDICLSPDLGLT